MKKYDDIFDKDDYKLVVAVVARGYSGEVINMAKSAGAKGAVVLSGTGAGESQRSFFGLTVNPENEVIMIVTPTDIVMEVIENAYKAVDYKSRARGLVFALPIDYVTGMSHAKEDEEIN
ncbi:MAG: hypothetical protein IJS68_04000 [Clostridia bacterium]|nr:hypothetical protein [Clostridia bacterium]